MSIQSNINTALSLASLLATQSPGLRAKAEERRELKKLGRKEKALEQQYKEVAGTVRETEPGEKIDELLKADEFGGTVFTIPPNIERAEKIEGQLADIAEKRFDIDPTSKTYGEALRAEYGVPSSERNQVLQFKSNLAAAKAQEATKVAQEQKRSTRRKFTDYLKDEPTSFGGTFSQLDPKLQKAIASQYSKSQRKAIMDRKDEMNGKE